MDPSRAARRTLLLMTTVGLAAALSASPALAGGSVSAYAVPTTGDYDTVPLLSVGDDVPETGNTSQSYQMVGIPDGLGSFRQQNGNTVLFMNHELTSDASSEPQVGRALNRGGLVSRYVLDPAGTVLHGKRAYDTVWQENIFRGPAPTTANTTRAFSRLCSASLAYRDVGFDRPIFLTGEEDSDPAKVFDGIGPQVVAVVGGQAHALPRLGRFAKENSLVQPGTGNKTVIMTLEDGPSSPDSQLYMYVGTKDPNGTTALRRNGLDNGELYVFAAKSAVSEVAFQAGTISGSWVHIPSAGLMTPAELEAASDEVGAFRFIRIEDGAFGKRSFNRFYFVTTGGATGNQLGRLYRLRMDPRDPTGNATLTIVYNADTVVAGGGDIALSPDNIDTSMDYLMIQEDGTTQSRAVFAEKGREGSIWRIPVGDLGPATAVTAAERVVELDLPGRDGVPVPTPGTWESSGIIDTTASFGADTWLFDVQAHAPTTAPEPNTVEDGQLLLLRPAAVTPTVTD